MQKFKVVSIEVKDGNNSRGAFKKYDLTGENNRQVSIFDPPHIDASTIKEGDMLEIETEANGKYLNISSFKVAGHEDIPQSSKPNPSAFDKDQIYARRDAVTLAFGNAAKKASLTSILDKAENIYQWIVCGKLPDSPSKAQDKQGVPETPNALVDSTPDPLPAIKRLTTEQKYAINKLIEAGKPVRKFIEDNQWPVKTTGELSSEQAERIIKEVV